MNLQTFRAPTMGEALTQVKSVMGPDAIILHTRPGLNQLPRETAVMIHF